MKFVSPLAARTVVNGDTNFIVRHRLSCKPPRPSLAQDEDHVPTCASGDILSP